MIVRKEWSTMMKTLLTSIRISLVFMLLCGVLYNAAITGIAGALMPKQASGSLITNEQGAVIGSELIGQLFTDPTFFHGRESSINYQAAGSGSTNYAPSSADLAARMQTSIEEWVVINPEVPISKLPIDLITNSASGLDPHISPEAAQAQVPRISELTHIPQQQLEELVAQYTEQRTLGFLGEPVVNVLKLNIALQKGF